MRLIKIKYATIKHWVMFGSLTAGFYFMGRFTHTKTFYYAAAFFAALLFIDAALNVLLTLQQRKLERLLARAKELEREADDRDTKGE